MRSENPNQLFVGYVLDFDEMTNIATIEQRNKFLPGDTLEVFSPNNKTLSFIIDEIKDVEGNILDSAKHPKEILKIKIPFKVSKHNMVRKVKT